MTGALSYRVQARPMRRKSFFTAMPIEHGIALVVAVVMSLLADDWIAGASILVLWAGWRWLPREGPPVLAVAFTFQWLQVTSGLFYHVLTGRPVWMMERCDYRSMMLIGLGCLIATLFGLKLGYSFIQQHSAAKTPRMERAINWQTIAVVYIASVAVAGFLMNMAWTIPALTQPILAISNVRYVLLFLVFRRLTWPRFRWFWFVLLLSFEVMLGFSGFFAGFREPLIFGIIACLEIFNRRNAAHWFAVGALLVLVCLTAFIWQAIKPTIRREAIRDPSRSTTEQLSQIGSLTSNLTEQNSSRLMADMDKLVERMWPIYFPALALHRVPAVLPHEHGAILADSLEFVFAPRLLFPDKPQAPSDSNKVRLYSGVWVSGREQGTSIAFGYAAESYVDFGVPGMFVPVFIYACMMGLAYGGVFKVISNREVAIGVVTVILWLSLYLFECSWVSRLGISFSLLIYVGLAGFLLNVWLASAASGRHPGRGPLTRTVPYPQRGLDVSLR